MTPASPRIALPSSLVRTASAIAIASLSSQSLLAQTQNAYVQVNLVSNRAADNPQIIDPLLRDAWGIAIRPPGAGGHWWITNAASGTTTTYVGDVPGVPLYQDALTVVDIPTSQLDRLILDPRGSQPTGVVYTGWSSTDFMVTGEGITGPSKFVFNGLEGTISGWTTGQTSAVTMVDNSLAGSMFTGLATTESPSGNRLYAADFGLETIRTYNHLFQPITTLGNWRDPAVPGTYSAFNIQYLEGRIYVAWARLGDNTGEEEHYPGYGFISAFDTEGRLLQSFAHTIELNAPWGLAIAPSNFGAMSGKLLVGNFGDGKILAFDRTSGDFIDVLRSPAGTPIIIDGLWGLQFGNGVRLGYTNHLYFAAGPNQEADGLFGKLVPLSSFCLADVSLGGGPGQDGIVDGNDFVAFINAFAASDPLADVASPGATPGADGIVDGDDFIAFINTFASGC